LFSALLIIVEYFVSPKKMLVKTILKTSDLIMVVTYKLIYTRILIMQQQERINKIY
jgi:hypothetical protein